MAFAERVLPRAADLWVQASLEQRQRFQQLFLPERISFDGNGFVGTAVTAPALNYLRPIEAGKEGVVSQICPMEPTDELDAPNRVFQNRCIAVLLAARGESGRSRRLAAH